MQPFVGVTDGHEKHGPRQVPHEVLLPPAEKGHFPLRFPPQPLNIVGVRGLIGGVYEINGVVDCQVFVSLVLKALVRFPAVPDDARAGENTVLRLYLLTILTQIHREASDWFRHDLVHGVFCDWVK